MDVFYKANVTLFLDSWSINDGTPRGGMSTLVQLCIKHNVTNYWQHILQLGLQWIVATNIFSNNGCRLAT